MLSRSNCSCRMLVMKPESCSREAMGAICLAQAFDSFARERRNSDEIPRRCSRARQIRFIADQNPASLLLCAFDQREIVRFNRRGKIHHHQRHVGIGHGLIAALDPQRLDHILAGANPGRIHEFHWDSVDRRHFRHQIARGAGDVGHNGAILFQQPVEQTALADVGPPDDGQRDSRMHQLAVVEARSQRGESLLDRIEAPQDLLRPARR